MNFFLRRLSIFIVGLVIVNFSVFYLSFKPAIFENYLYNNSSIDSYNTYLFGDSHAHDLLGSTNAIDVFNFANSSENFLDMYLKVQYLSKRITKEDTVLICVDNHCLGTYREGGRINENVIYGNDFTDVKKEDLPNAFYLNSMLSFLPLAFPVYNLIQREYLSNLINTKTSKEDFSKETDLQKRSNCKMRFEQQFQNRKLSKKQKFYLMKTIAILKSKNVTIIGIRFPITVQYLNLINKKDFGIGTFLERNNIPVIDFQNKYSDHNEFFRDQDHLNSFGAKIFCADLKKELNKIK